MQYANKFAGYREISNDNNLFMEDYSEHSLFKKVPQPYQKLMQNYGTLDYKELDPKLRNLFSTTPSTRGTTRRTLTRGQSVGQIPNTFMSPKASFANSQYSGGFLEPIKPNTALGNNQNELKNQLLASNIKDEIIDSTDSKPRTAQQSVQRKINLMDSITNKNDKLLSPKSHSTIAGAVKFGDIITDFEPELNRNPMLQMSPDDPQYLHHSNIQSLKRVISTAYKSIRNHKFLTNKQGQPKKIYNLSIEDIERMRHFEENQLKLLEAAVQLELRNLLQRERNQYEQDKLETLELHQKLLNKKLARASSQNQNQFFRRATLVGMKFDDGINLPSQPQSVNNLNFNFSSTAKKLQYSKTFQSIKPNMTATQFKHSSTSMNSPKKNKYAHSIYSKEEMLFHELQKMITKLTSNKSQEMSFPDKFKSIETLKNKVNLLKKSIDSKTEEDEPAMIKLAHTKFIDQMIDQLEKQYKTQYINQSKKKFQRESLKTQLTELEARDNQLRNTNFKFKKFYQKDVEELHEMKDYLREIQDKLSKHYEQLELQKGQLSSVSGDVNTERNKKSSSILNQGRLSLFQKKREVITKKSVRFGNDPKIEEKIDAFQNDRAELSKIEEIDIQEQTQDVVQDNVNGCISEKASPLPLQKIPYQSLPVNDHMQFQDIQSNLDDLNNQSLSGYTENQSVKNQDNQLGDYESDSSIGHQTNDPLIETTQKMKVEYKDFDNIGEIIHEYFNPLAQNKKIVQNKHIGFTTRRKTVKGDSVLASSQNVIKDLEIINDLAKLEMKQIGTAEELQRLIAKATSPEREQNKRIAHQYTVLRKNLQKKLKNQDIEKLKNLTLQLAQDQDNISLTNSSKSQDLRQKNNQYDKDGKKKNLGKQETNDFNHLLFHNLSSIQNLRIFANEHGVIEKLEEYSQKNGVFDDHLKEWISKLKNYKTNLEIIDKKFIQIAANHLNL
ncbi:UNKNOWN [Stylonychia lemnae]|uniref:Uncharacterized protein n=1 Tax=Stylonychia lemnae TaxID=5949 RepID=A0A078A1L5_STYLE|nr:UNKNOWN [Stylonychia lemnae]|eukprot:CDW75343.1 UNKNOWN [Stylonychia lemnae]